MKKQVKIFILAMSIGLFLSCESKFQPTNNLEATKLLLPENKSECLGEKLPSDQILVTFDWEDVTGASSFLLEYEEIINGQQFSETVTESSLELVLEPGTQYTWTITANDNFGNSKKSTPFSFYTEGLATPNHVPFPAELEISNNNDGTANLFWDSFDLDNDIDFYQVFFSEENPPLELFASTLETFTSVDIIEGETYYFKVLAYDKNGNYSEAEISKEF